MDIRLSEGLQRIFHRPGPIEMELHVGREFRHQPVQSLDPADVASILERERPLRERNRPDYQERLDEYNARLEEKCAELGAGFIQISERLKGTDNHLNPEYSTDARFHLNTEGVDVWLQCMLDYAQEQYDLGLSDPFGGEKPAAKPVATPTDLQAE